MFVEVFMCMSSDFKFILFMMRKIVNIEPNIRLQIRNYGINLNFLKKKKLTSRKICFPTK